MLTLKTLPSAATSVPTYQSTGEVSVVETDWFPGTRATFRFVELVPDGGEMTLDPLQLTPEERQLAQSPQQGALLGLIALPEALVRAALDSGQGKLYAQVQGRKVAVSSLFDAPESDRSMIVAGVYEGHPPVGHL